jgi:futalosine hydrolase
MRLLLVAATRPEVTPLVEALASVDVHDGLTSGVIGGHRIDLLLTGVGMVATSAHCSRVLAGGGYDAALNLGVCGSFNDAYPPGTVVHVTSDMMSELGVEDGSRFLTMQQIGLLDPDAVPFTGGRLVNHRPMPLGQLAELPSVSGITVNTVHGDEASIAAVVEQYSPDVESMEGAAFMYSCLIAGVPFAQVRAVSNRVERRNRAAWDLPGAIRELGRVSLELLHSQSAI